MANKWMEAKWKERTEKTTKEHVKLLEVWQGRFTHCLFGDSMLERFKTTGLGMLPDEEAGFLNLGIGGDKVENVRYRLRLVLPHLVKQPLKVIIFMIGTNNLEDTQFSGLLIAAATCSLILEITQALPAARLKVLSLPLRRSQNSKITEKDMKDRIMSYNEELLKALGDRVPFISFHDIWGEIDKGGMFIPMFHDDLVHFSKEGYQLFAKALLPLLENPE